MKKYDLNKVIFDLNELKKQCSQTTNTELCFYYFRMRYPFTSSYIEFERLLTNTDIPMDIIAKLLISECENQSLDDSVLEDFDKDF